MKQKILNTLRKLFGIPQMQWQLNQLQSNQMTKSDYRQFQLWDQILHEQEPGVTNDKYSDATVTVSLTTYGRRMKEAALAIESIMQQTMKANRIVLWLAHEDYKHIPQSLRMLQARGLEIMECDDLLSYKKIIPSLRKFPDDVIITIDDDVFYSPDALDNLVSAYLEAPQHIHCLRTHRVKTDANGIILPYNQWEWGISEPGPNRRNFFTGCGGVLYPPHCLDEEVLNESVFMKICKHADDVWLNAMALRKGTLVSKVLTRNPNGEDYVLNERAQADGLFQINIRDQMLNDRQLKDVFTTYSLYDKIKGKED